MAGKLKIVYIGACSHRFSIGLFRNIVAAISLHPIDVVLVDLDEKLLAYMHKILENMAKKAKVEVKVESTTRRREVLENADFVYLSLSVGAQEGEWTDIHLPLKFGIPQNTGDTVGPGGIFRGLRCIPVVSNIVKDVKELCPNAVILNYTNPMSTLMLAANTVAPQVQTIGLCHELFGGASVVRDLMVFNGFQIQTWEDLDIEYGGINHLAWLTRCKYGEEDVYPLLNEECMKGDFGKRRLNFHLLGEYGLFPYPGGRHLAEFIPRYYNYFNYLSEPFGIKVRDVKSLDVGHKWTVNRFVAMSKDWYRNRLPTPNVGGEKAMQMTTDWKFGIYNKHVVNIPNRGLISNLPEDCIVEVPGYFSQKKIQGVKVGALPEKIASVVGIHAKNQRLIVEAALKGDKGLLLEALLNDPMCAFIENPDIVQDMMENMLYYQSKWLPYFKDVLSQEELVSRHFVKPEELATKEIALKVKYPPEADLRYKSWLSEE